MHSLSISLSIYLISVTVPLGFQINDDYRFLVMFQMELENAMNRESPVSYVAVITS